MPARNLAILIIATLVSMVCYRTAAKNHYGALLSHAISEIDNKFVREVDQRDLFEGAMDGMVRRLDPYSGYITPKQLEAFSEELGQEFGGIGIVVEVNRDTKRLTVLSPLPDTPAYSAGMRAGDQILSIDGQSTEGFQVRDAVDLMRGKPGSELVISVLHAGEDEPVEMKLERAIITIASVLGDARNPDGTWQFQLEKHPEIGYIRLTTFGEKTTDELRETIQELQPKVKGLILDLRGNGGGLLDKAVDICDLFIEKGSKIVSIRGRDPQDWDDYVARSDSVIAPNLPMAVLIDGYSASAAEIMAACLQDHNRAIIVGMRSWGKGTVQTVMPFEGGRSRLKLTVATYWRPSGKNIHRHVDATENEDWGVTPNEGFEVKVDESTLEKIVYQRRERDKVNIEMNPPADAGSDDEASSSNNDSEPTFPSTNLEDTVSSESDESKAKERRVPDIEGFEDPQLQRAIDAIREQIDAPTELQNAA